MRIAWIGPAGEGAGNAPLGTLLLKALLAGGAEVDVYFEGEERALPRSVAEHPAVQVVAITAGWSWDRWYSRRKLEAFVSGLAARSRAHLALSRELIARNRRSPYACVLQFSQPELFLLALRWRELPPIVVHPGTHAAGELRWHRRESPYARASEPFAFHYATRALLAARAAVQRHDLRRARLVLCPSRNFMGEVEHDYGLDHDRMRVLRHPVDLDRFHPDGGARAPDRTIRILFVSRLAVRKGLELVVGLSHRLDDLAGRVAIEVIGDRGLWSNYAAHVEELNPRVARYAGPAAAADLAALLRAADGLMVPSRYEPGSLIVGQALASGLPVIMSDRVGPSEVLGLPAARVFPSGDLDALERVTRELVADIRARGGELSAAARRAAVELFAPPVIGEQLMSCLAEAGGAGLDREAGRAVA